VAFSFVVRKKYGIYRPWVEKMMDGYFWSELVTGLGQLSGFALVVATGIGFYYREKIKQILTLDVERVKAELQAQNGQLLAQQQRELEAYKVGLIAQAEHAKAVQEVRTQVAARLAERRFEALLELVDAIRGVDDDAASVATTRPSEDESERTSFTEARSAVLDRIKRIREALKRANPYLSGVLMMESAHLIGDIVTVCEARKAFAELPLGDDDKRIESMTQRAIKLEIELFAILNTAEAMSQSASRDKSS
jgi:hypothetical protein